MTLEIDTDLHRLVWSPDDFDDDGNLITSAFRRKDLHGGADYVSVSRVDELDSNAEIALAEAQAKKADGVNFVREKAFSALLHCLAVCEVQDDSGNTPFQVTSEPIPGVNQAHCGIRNVAGKKSNGYVNQLRLLLVDLVHKSQGLDEFLRSIEK